VCNGKLAIPPSGLKGPGEDMPQGCSFHCRNNMTMACEQAGKEACKTNADVMRFQCPELCGVCSVLEMESDAVESYPKRACEGEGDAELYKDNCADWASRGECIKNFGFMKNSCAKSCGLCVPASEGGSVPVPYAEALKKTSTGNGKKKKKTKKKTTTTTTTTKSETAAVEESAEKNTLVSEAAGAETEKGEEVANPAAAEPAVKASKDAEVEATGAKDGGNKKEGFLQGVKGKIKGMFGSKDKSKEEL